LTDFMSYYDLSTPLPSALLAALRRGAADDAAADLEAASGELRGD